MTFILEINKDADKKAILTLTGALNKTDSALNRLNRKLGRYIAMETWVDAEQSLDMEWDEVIQTVDGLADVATALPNHRLHPAISRFVDIAKGWADMKKKLEKEEGIVPIFNDVRHLTQMPMSYGISSGKIYIWVHCPFTPRQTKLWELWQWASVPWVTRDHVIRLKEPNKILAKREGATMELDLPTLGKLDKIGELFIWTEPTTEDLIPNTCLAAVDAQDYEMAIQTCSLTMSTRRLQAWPLENNRFLVDMTENGAEVVTKCGDAVNDISRRNGIAQVTIHNDRCRLILNRTVALRPARRSEASDFVVEGAPEDWIANVTMPEGTDNIPIIDAPNSVIASIYHHADATRNHRNGNSIGLGVAFLATLISFGLFAVGCCLACKAV